MVNRIDTHVESAVEYTTRDRFNESPFLAENFFGAILYPRIIGNNESKKNRRKFFMTIMDNNFEFRGYHNA
jgi:hypothetical protein